MQMDELGLITDCAETNSLCPYEGPWSVVQAAHLLRRTTFGLDHSKLYQALQLGMEKSVDKLLEDLPFPELPVNYDYNSDANVPIGSTWVEAPFHTANGYMSRSFRAWNVGRQLANEFNIREKMVMFWHNHFVIEAQPVNDPRYQYRNISIFMEHPLGNFKDMVDRVTVDPAMLRYLNGNQNRRQSPNENYARELFELFTLGKGQLAGPGDYTTFTEEDVRAAARVLTGWQDIGYRNQNTGNITVNYVNNRHDTGIKQFSHRFGNAVINNEGNQEYKRLIDLIFTKEETAEFICRKLYRWFVYYKIDEQIDSQIIKVMAANLRAANFEIKPVIRKLLMSQHFFDTQLSGCLVKNPIEFITHMASLLKIRPTNNTLLQQYRLWFSIAQTQRNLQMEYFNAPDVAGWKPYYQEPGYNQLWINPVSIQSRAAAVIRIVLNENNGVNFTGTYDVIPLIDSLSNPFDINDILAELNSLMMSYPFTDPQLLAIKEVILPGLPDYEWTLEYELHKQQPNNVQIRRSLEQKFRSMLVYMMQMPEYQLS
jgi:uncharacterized protein (DUF1800 family)